MSKLTPSYPMLQVQNMPCHKNIHAKQGCLTILGTNKLILYWAYLMKNVTLYFCYDNIFYVLNLHVFITHYIRHGDFHKDVDCTLFMSSSQPLCQLKLKDKYGCWYYLGLHSDSQFKLFGSRLFCQVTATHLKIGYPHWQISSKGAPSSKVSMTSWER